mmetsp:Transcript_61005/g.154991  ORF Transcript_61005/g.154991 Transcript_61005/m.154991 type:complete len:127 (-) Transcript_61005:74-454(-)
MGPWGSVLQQAMDCTMLGVKYHSVLMRTGRVLNEAVFFSGLGDPEVSSEMDGAEIALKQSCYLPFTKDSVPCMGIVPKHSNVYVATGHGCWGVMNSLASGLAMSELIIDGEATSVDLSPFDPERFA